MIRDLGEEFDALEQDNRDIMSIIVDYGHGDCHALTHVLIEDYNFIPMAVMAEDSGMPVHSAVRLAGNRTLDAYGINTIERTLERYQGCCMDYLGSEAYIQEVDEEFIAFHAGHADEDFIDIVRKDAKRLIEFLGLDPEKAVAESRAETVTDYIE